MTENQIGKRILDLAFENKVIVELKSIEALQRVHAKQVLTQLRLANLRLGYLINFRRRTSQGWVLNDWQIA